MLKNKKMPSAKRVYPTHAEGIYGYISIVILAENHLKSKRRIAL